MGDPRRPHPREERPGVQQKNAGPFFPGDVGAADPPSWIPIERVAAIVEEEAADGEAGALVDDGVDELVWVESEAWLLLLYGRLVLLTSSHAEF